MAQQLLKFIRPERKPRPASATSAAGDYASLTDVEREFLPHLLEIEATPPSRFERRLRKRSGSTPRATAFLFR